MSVVPLSLNPFPFLGSSSVIAERAKPAELRLLEAKLAEGLPPVAALRSALGAIEAEMELCGEIQSGFFPAHLIEKNAAPGLLQAAGPKQEVKAARPPQLTVSPQDRFEGDAPNASHPNAGRKAGIGIRGDQAASPADGRAPAKDNDPGNQLVTLTLGGWITLGFAITAAFVCSLALFKSGIF